MNDNDVPTLEAHFAITANFDEITRAQAVMESAEGKILRNARVIEQATGGMVKLGGATAQMTTFGNTASSEMATVARATALAERAGEGLMRQLNRQIETFGKTASEIRDMRIELRAVEAESKGLTELATRLRAAGAEVRKLEAGTRLLPGANNGAKASMQNFGFQVQDFAVQVVGGTSALRAFALQAPQAAGALSGFQGRLGTIGAFLNGPWGIAITLGVTLLAGFADKLFSAGEEATDSAIKIDRLTQSVRTLAAAQGRVTAMDLGNSMVKLTQLEGQMSTLQGKIAGAQGTRAELQRKNLLVEQSKELQIQIDETRSVVKGSEMRLKIMTDAEERERKAAAAAKAATAATREHSRELTAAEQKAEKLYQFVIDTRLIAQGNVQKLGAEVIRQHQEWGRGIETVGEKLIEQKQESTKLTEAEKQGQQDILDIYLRQLDVIQQIGGAAGTVAALLSGLETGNFSGVGGDLGRLLNSASTVIGKDGWKEVTSKLDSLFGSSGDGSFARTVSSGLGAFSFAVEANKMIGNIFGFKGGPLGIFTSLFDSIVNPSRSAGATLTSGSGYTIGGKDKKQYGVAEGLGDSVLGGLSQIASALGVKVGSFNTTIGIRDGDYRVNTDGTSLKLKNGAVDFGEDAEAAIKYAIADAIKDGALMGLRASTQALLKAGDNIEAQLEKALQFESVFTELKAMTDPVGAAIDTLDKQFAQLRDVFAEAGASAAEYADLEQLYQLKKVAAIKQANSEAEELSRDRRTLEARILALQGKDLQSVAMLRQIEIEQMDASLRPLQQRVWAMEDATAIIEKMQPMVDSLQAYRDTLFGQTDGALSYRTALVKLMQTGGLAAGGDATALAKLQGVSQDFLTSARNNASSLAQYQRDVAMVARYVDGGIDAAQNQIDVAQATLDATNASVLLLASIDDTLSAAADAAAISTSSATGSAGSMADLGAKIDALKAELEQMRADNNAGHAATAGNTGKLVRTLDNVTAVSGGDAIATIPAV